MVRSARELEGKYGDNGCGGYWDYAIAWNISAEKEFRHKMPEKGRFFPSR